MTDPNTGAQATAAATAADTSAATAAVTVAVTAAQTVAETAAVSSAAVTTAATAAQSVAGPPERYEFKLPAGAKVEPAFVERIAATARARGLGNEAGQAVLDAVLSEVNTYRPGGTEWTRQNEADKALALADPELGAGDPAKLAEATALAQRSLSKWFPDVSDDFLKATGLASKPQLLKGLVRIARASQESTLVLGGTVAGETKSLAERLYGPDGRGPTSKKTE